MPVIEPKKEVSHETLHADIAVLAVQGGRHETQLGELTKQVGEINGALRAGQARFDTIHSALSDIHNSVNSLGGELRGIALAQSYSDGKHDGKADGVKSVTENKLVASILQGVMQAVVLVGGIIAASWAFLK